MKTVNSVISVFDCYLLKLAYQMKNTSPFIWLSNQTKQLASGRSRGRKGDGTYMLDPPYENLDPPLVSSVLYF